jgi:tetratricopeptide (TPR) repeat protein
MFGKWKLERVSLICVLPALGVAAVYLPAVFLEFINYDDPYYVTENSHIRAGLSGTTLVWAMTHTCVGHWQPLTLLSHALDCQVYGLNPAGHHLTSVILHATNTIVLFLLLRLLTGSTTRSAAVAALFSLHPLRVESVAWISERKDVLSAFFGLLSLWAYVAYAKSREGQTESANSQQATQFYISAVVLLALGLMSKAMLVTWPCVMLLLDYWPLNRLGQLSRAEFSLSRFRQLILEKIPFFALSGASCVATFLAARADAAYAPLQDISIRTRILNALIAYGRYIGKSIWPLNLSPIYPYLEDWPRWEIVLAPLLLVVLTALAIWKRNRRPYWSVGWAWFLGVLVPVIGLVQVGSQSMADRYTYIPTIGLLIAVVWTVADVAASHMWRRRVTVMMTTAALVGCALLTQRQLMYWQNTETLFRHAIAISSDNFIAWNNLGFYFAEFHESKQAEQCLRAALAFKPGNFYSLEKLASVFIDEGRYAEAETGARKALEVNPRMSAAHRTLGLALMKQGKAAEAIKEYEEALRLDPDNATAHYNLGNALARLEQFDKAREQFQETVRLDPTNADAHNNLAYMLVREGKLGEATSEFKAALRFRPDSWHARYGLGDALVRQGKLKEAADEFLQVLKTQPTYSGALIQLNRIGWILASHPAPQVRDGKKALELAERLCELTAYRNATMIETLAAAQAELGRFTEAINSIERARTLALEAGQKDVAQKAQELAELFRTGRPYREKAGPGGR